MSDTGKTFTPTAKYIWDCLVSTKADVRGHLNGDAAEHALNKLQVLAEKEGESVYNELVETHRQSLAREKDKNEYSFCARRTIIEKIGLPEVKKHRLQKLEQEKEARRRRLEKKEEIFPEIQPLLILRVEGHC